MGRVFAYRERVYLEELLPFVYEQQKEAEEVGLFLYSIYCHTVSGHPYLFDVTLVFTK